MSIAAAHALAAVALAHFAAPAAQATTYVWDNSNVTGGTPLDWFAGGPDTPATWNGGAPTAGAVTNADTIQFFTDTSTAFTNTTAVTQTSTINDGGSPVELGTLTLNGKGSATGNANYTLTISGDALNFSAATGTINLNGTTNGRAITYNLNSNILLGSAGTANTLTITGGGSDTFNIGGSISELQAGSSIVKSGSSTVSLNGVLSQTGGLTMNAGTLNLTNTNNTYSGGTTVNGGTIAGIVAGSFGSGDITIAGNSVLAPGYGVFPTVANNLAVNGGATLTIGNYSQYYGIKFSGVVSGSGTITFGGANNANSSPSLGLTNANNTFTGTLQTAGGSAAVYVNSLPDSANPIKLNGGIFALAGGAATPLVFNSRHITLAGTTSGGEVDNNNATATNTITINTDLAIAGTGNKTFTLGGSNSGMNTFAGNIANGTGSVISLTKAGASTWVLSGTNTYSGATTFNAGSNGTTIFQGIQALSPNTAVTQNQVSSGGSFLKLLDDSAGNGGVASTTTTFALNTVNGSGIGNQANSIFVGNNGTANGGSNPGSTVTGETISVGKLTMISNATSGGSNAIGWNTISGANGYRLQINNVDLPSTANVTTGTVAAYFVPTSASVTLAGNIQQLNGNNKGNQLKLQLDGTNSASLVTGNILDAADYTSGSNATAKPLALTKSNTSTWILSGANAYTGGTTISGGTLQFANTGAMPATGTVAVQNNATIAVNAGGAGEFTNATSGTGSIGGLLAGTGGQGAAVTYAGNVKLGIDTTNAGGPLTYADNIANVATSLGITKLGTGALVLSGASTYTGATSVNAGTLSVTGSLGSTAVTVASSATLAGSGTVGGAVSIQTAGNLAPSAVSGTPSASPLVLTGGVTLAAGSTYAVNLASASSYDQVQFGAGKTATLGGSTLTINDSGYIPTLGDTFWVLDGQSGSTAIPDQFASSVVTGSATGAQYTVTYNQPNDPLGTSNDALVTVTAVPEPASVALLAFGAVGLLVRRRRASSM